MCAASLITIALILAGTSLAQSNPIPFVNQPLVPDATAPGGPDFTLIVNGTGFVSGATVNWNGAALATTFVDQSQLTATVPAADTATPGTASVTVTNPSPGGGTSSVQFFSMADPAASVTFAEYNTISGAASDSFNLPVADFNRDSKLDLILACLVPGVGDGSFGPPQCNHGSLEGQLYAVSDFNGDGILDVAIAYFGAGPFGVLLGNGDGTFQGSFGGIINDNVDQFQAADFNGDGKVDLAIIDDDSLNPPPTLQVYLGNGDGTFQPHIDTPAGSLLTIGDYDRDGKLDFASDNRVMLGNGDGTFRPGSLFNLGRVAAAADLNGDGKLDLIAFDVVSDLLVTALGNGDGTFQPAASFPGISSGLIADVDGDGKLDAISIEGKNVRLLLGNGDGTFQNVQTVFVTSHTARAVVVGDFNGDGKVDLAISNGTLSSEDLTVLLQGQFAMATVAPATITFDPQAPGTTSPVHQVTLTNSGNAPLTISGTSISGTNASDFAETNNCPSSLAAGHSCTISVTFTPTVVSARTGSLTVTDSSPGGQQSVGLSGTVQDFTIASVPPTTQTVTPGQAANYSVTVAPVLGFAGTVTLTCSGAPTGATCSVTPSSLPGTGTANVAVVTRGASGGFTQELGDAPRNSLIVQLAFASLLGLTFLASWMGRHRWSYQLRYILAVLCLVAIGGWVSCGGGSGNGGGGTPTGNYTLTVTGTYTAGGVIVNHHTQFTLVVK